MVLVTGATGHIGNVLVRELLKRETPVRVLIHPGEMAQARKSGAEKPISLQNLDVEIFQGDILNPKELQPAFKSVETVYHLAGMISILPGKQNYMQRVNVEGTHNALWAALANGVKRFVYTSSIHAFTRIPHGKPMDESLSFDPENPFGAYDRSKAQASIAAQTAALAGLDVVITCPTGVIGPYDYHRSEMGQFILDSICKKINFYVDGAYDFVDVRDVVHGLVSAAENGKKGTIYILSGMRVTIQQLLETLQKITGNAATKIKIPYKLAQFFSIFTPVYYQLRRLPPRFTSYSLEVLQSNAHISSEKARKELGYVTRPVMDTLIETVQWFKPAWKNLGAKIP